MSSLTLLGDTSGSVILQAPAVAGSSTVTLPTTGGTIRTTTTPGTVLQVVSDSYGSNVSWTGTNIYLSLQSYITPISSTSKILAIATIQCATSGTGRLQFFFRANTTSSDNSGTAYGSTYVAQPAAASTNQLMSATISALIPSINTSSNFFVKLCSTKHDGGTGYINSIGDECRIVLMEIAA